MKNLKIPLSIFLCTIGVQQVAYAQSSSSVSSSAVPVSYQCNDGIDNDGDGAIDLLDFSCESSIDGSESNPIAQCQDGKDNDKDSLIDMADPGCASPQDNNEGDKTTQCQDGIDNDGDGKIDTKDTGCDGKTDNSELKTNGPQCDNGIDDDGDGLIDMQDLGCANNTDRSERLDTVCDNGFDDDGDGAIDLNDPGCTKPSDTAEKRANGFQCDNGIDDDNDGYIDTSDDGCSSPSDNNEHGTTQCDDGIDNDSDGLTDYPVDPECSDKSDTTENINELASNAYNITVELKDSQDPIKSLEALVYTIKVTNLETKRIVQSEITLNIDTGLEFISATNGGLKEGDGIIRWKNISMNARSTVELTATVQYTSTVTRVKTLTATATGNTSKDEEKTKLEPEKKPNADITITSSTEYGVIGDAISYQIILNNDVNKDGTIDVRAFVDKNTDVVSVGNGGIENNGVIKWNDLYISANGTLSIPLVVQIEDYSKNVKSIKLEVYSGDNEKTHTLNVGNQNSSSSSSSFSSSSSSYSSFGYLDPLDNTNGPFGQFQPYYGPDSNVTLEVLADRNEIQPGSLFYYNVALHNPLQSPLENIVLEHQFPQDSISIINPANGTISGQNIYWSNLSVPPQQTLNLRVQARANNILQHGTQFQSITTLRGGLLTQPISIPNTLHIISQLPQTGAPIKHALDGESMMTVRKQDSSSSPVISIGIWMLGLLMILPIGMASLRRF